jgi:methylated-DNA-protein-cysteine methyltransferase-like protein
LSSDDKKYGFFDDAQAVARLIPKGRVTSYGAIANYLSAPRSARMVGYAMKASSGDDTVPAHRVVNRVGLLSGKHNFDEPNEMQIKLEQEGVIVIANQIQDFEKLFWDPTVELKL